MKKTVKHTMKKPMLTRALALVMCLMMLALFAGCAEPEAEAAATRVMALKGPTGLGLSYMMSDEAVKSEGFTFEVVSAPEDVVSAVVSGEVDIAAVPINLAATLNKKTDGGVKVIAVNTLGVLYVLENGTEVSEIGDLAGKTLYASGQGSTPEYVLNYLLDKNGLTDAVTVEYVSEHSELATLAASGEAELSLLPEPNVTSVLMKNDSVRIALNLTEEWNKVCDTELVQGVFIVRTAFLEEHENTVNSFLTHFSKSAANVNSNPEEAGKLAEENGILSSAAAAAKAIPNCNIVCKTGAEMKSNVSAMLKVLYDANPKSVGGELPEDAFYYEG